MDEWNDAQVIRKIAEAQEAMLIVHQPGKALRVGYTIGNVANNLREWKKHCPNAAIYVIQAANLPAPGSAVVVTAEEYLSIDDAKQELTSNNLADDVTKAMRRAWFLGQEYWQLADSESYSENRQSDEIGRKFEALMKETRDSVLSGGASVKGEQ